MKINISCVNKKNIPFSKVKAGQCFIAEGWNETEILMCMSTEGLEEGSANVVSLLDGETYQFSADDEVLHIDEFEVVRKKIQ